MIWAWLGDTVTISDTVTAIDGNPVDLTGATVQIAFAGQPEMTDDAVIEDAAAGTVSYTTEADATGVFQTRWLVSIGGGGPTTYLGPSLRIADADNMWATPADIEAITGKTYPPEDALRAIDAATVLIASWLCVPVPDPLPPEFTVATAIIAGALLDAPEAGDRVVSETIGDYTYRLSAAPNKDELRNEIRHLLGPYLCGNAMSVRVWPGGPVWWDDITEYQPDAEGLWRS